MVGDSKKSDGGRAHALKFFEGQLVGGQVVEGESEEDSGKSVVAGSLVVSERFEYEPVLHGDDSHAEACHGRVFFMGDLK